MADIVIARQHAVWNLIVVENFHELVGALPLQRLIRFIHKVPV